jgi:hypothetical protein
MLMGETALIVQAEVLPGLTFINKEHNVCEQFRLFDESANLLSKAIQVPRVGIIRTPSSK